MTDQKADETTEVYLRVRDILGPGGILPISRAKFYELVAAGKLPKPLKVGRISLWRRSDLLAAIEAVAE